MAGPPAQKKSFLSPKWYVWVHFDAVFNKQKARIVTIDPSGVGHRFHGSIAKRTLQRQCKNYPKVHGLTKRGGGRSHNCHPLPPWIRHWFCFIRVSDWSQQYPTSSRRLRVTTWTCSSPTISHSLKQSTPFRSSQPQGQHSTIRSVAYYVSSFWRIRTYADVFFYFSVPGTRIVEACWGLLTTSGATQS